MNNTIYVGSGGGYYGGSAILTVRTEDDITTYEFSPSGWDFDTNSQLEAAAICASANNSFLKEISESQLDTLPISDISEDDINEALFWLTGGNAQWYHGYWSEEGIEWGKEVLERLNADEEIIGYIKNAVSSSKNFAELVTNIRAIYHGEPSIFVCAIDTLADLAVYDEDEEEL